MFKGIWRDFVYAARSLAKSRSFTFVCVVTLGIGMAPVIAIPYGARLLLMTPPAVHTEGLVEVITTRVGPRAADDDWSYPDFMDLRAADTGIAMTGWATAGSKVKLQGSADETQSPTMFVSGNYFRTIGVALARGPGFDAVMDDPLKAEPVVILGHSFWQNRLGSDPDIIGKTISLNEIPHVVVGVGPDRFGGHLAFQEAELFVPLERHPLLIEDGKVRADRNRSWVQIHGRLAPGVGVAQASAAVSAVTSHLAKQYPATNELKAGTVAAYDSIGTLARSQFAIFRTVALTLTGMVLLVVSLNISGMMQVRSAMRERELSIRQAIGASRGLLVR